MLKVPYTVAFARKLEQLSMYRVISSTPMCSIPTRGRRCLSHRPHRSSRAVFIATDSVLTPRARYSSIYPSSSRSHLLIAVLPNEKGGELAPRRYVIELNNMTPNMMVLGAEIGPELN